MSVWDAVAIGVRGARTQLRVALWTYAASVLVAAPAAVAVGAAVHGYFGKSLEAGLFAARMDPLLMGNLLREKSALLGSMVPLALAAFATWVAVSVFLGGATLAVVGRSAPATTRDVFGEGGRVFWRLVRLLLWALPVLALFGALPIFGLWKGFDLLTEDWVSEKGVLAARAGAMLLTFVVLAFVNGAYDLMRVHAVVDDEVRARVALWRGIVRAVRSPIGLLLVYVPFAGLAVLFTFTSSLVDANLERATWGAFVMALLLQQSTAFARCVLRVGLAGAEVAWGTRSRRF